MNRIFLSAIPTVLYLFRALLLDPPAVSATTQPGLQAEQPTAPIKEVPPVRPFNDMTNEQQLTIIGNRVMRDSLHSPVRSPKGTFSSASSKTFERKKETKKKKKKSPHDAYAYIHTDNFYTSLCRFYSFKAKSINCLNKILVSRGGRIEGDGYNLAIIFVI